MKFRLFRVAMQFRIYRKNEVRVLLPHCDISLPAGDPHESPKADMNGVVGNEWLANKEWGTETCAA